jgi:hypothetical protein
VATSPKQNEILQLKNEIASEISRDAPNIAQGVFGDNANHPDMSQVSNQQLDDLYRQKYIANDRTWLQAEARRDPVQFEKVTDRLGVVTPPPGSPAPPDPNAFANAAMASASAGPPAALPAASPPPAPAMPIPPALSAAVPAPVLAPPPVPAPAPPVILGPNGQPLPPMGQLAP